MRPCCRRGKRSCVCVCVWWANEGDCVRRRSDDGVMMKPLGVVVRCPGLPCPRSAKGTIRQATYRQGRALRLRDGRPALVVLRQEAGHASNEQANERRGKKCCFRALGCSASRKSRLLSHWTRLAHGTNAKGPWLTRRTRRTRIPKSCKRCRGVGTRRWRGQGTPGRPQADFIKTHEKG